MNGSVPGSFAGQGWVILTSFISVVTFVFWIVIAWRVMRAHERIASSLEQRLPR